ncbi:MAG TPA: hypothetical protein VM490_12205, partial [Armatimonadaceae bacterium]|nr:hypothetical protein [Armatimonadaceae bacterium]
MAETPAPRTLNTPHAFAPPASRDAWEARAEELRCRVLVSAGLWPLEKRRPPLRPRVTGRIERPDFVVENVALETLPGFHLCGNLYRPAAGRGPFPAVANPHGHWAKGRLHREEDVPPGP